MRGYGIPQAMWAVECHTDDVARAIGMEPVEFRRKNLMKKGFYHEFSKNELYFDTFNECMDKAIAYIDYYGKLKKYQNQTGPVRRGIGCSVFWYNTAVYPISLETSSCRMVLHPGGRIVFQCGETEIGQGADTVQAQMVADAVGVLASDVTVESLSLIHIYSRRGGYRNGHRPAAVAQRDAGGDAGPAESDGHPPDGLLFPGASLWYTEGRGCDGQEGSIDGAGAGNSGPGLYSCSGGPGRGEHPYFEAGCAGGCHSG